MTVPLLTAVAPVYELAPLSARSPKPALVSPPAPPTVRAISDEVPPKGMSALTPAVSVTALPLSW
jgi:hypothetical protein